MRMSVRALVATMMGLALAAGPSSAQETKTVTATGEGLTQELARKEAMRNALEQGAGVEISAHSKTENFELIRDTIFSRADGVVTSVKVLEQGEGAGGTYFCRIQAEVSPDSVAHEWGTIQNVLSQIGRPKVMVYIAETIDGQASTSSILESKIEERLIDLGFGVYDSQHLDATARREADHAAKSGDDAKMGSIAKNFGAQIFVMGNADADAAENTSPHGVNLVMYNCNVQAKAFYTDTAQLLASKSLPNVRGGARGQRAYSPQAGKMAIANAAQPLIDEMYETVMRSWAYQISGGGEIVVEIGGFGNAGQAFKVKKRFAEMRGVDSVNGPQYTDGFAVYRIKAKMTAEDMMDLLVDPAWEQVLEVEDVTLNRIQGKYKGG